MKEGRLYVNDQFVAAQQLYMQMLEGTLQVGHVVGSTISTAISSPFRFGGTLKYVKVELQ